MFMPGDDVVIWDSKGRPHFDIVASVEGEFVFVHGIKFNQDGTTANKSNVRIEKETAKIRNKINKGIW